MWNCEECGCQNIASGVQFCPQCYAEGEEMPRNTVGGGYSNQWAQDELPFEDEQPDEQPEPDEDARAGAQEEPEKAAPKRRKAAEEE